MQYIGRVGSLESVSIQTYKKFASVKQTVQNALDKLFLMPRSVVGRATDS